MDILDEKDNLKRALTHYLSTKLACWLSREAAYMCMEHEIIYEDARDIAIGALETNKYIFIEQKEDGS